MKKYIKLLVVTLAVCVLGAFPTCAAADVYSFGSVPKEQKGVNGDFFSASGSITADFDISGDLIAVAFSDVNVRSGVGGDVRSASGTFTADADIYKNATVFAGYLRLSETATVWGNAYFATGDAQIEGSIKNNLYLYSQNAVINGKINGDLILHTGFGKARLSETASVSGNIYHYGAFPMENAAGDGYHFYDTSAGADFVKPLVSGGYLFLISGIMLLLLWVLFGDFFMRRREDGYTAARAMLCVLFNFLKVLLVIAVSVLLCAVGCALGLPVKGITVFTVLMSLLALSAIVCVCTFFCYFVSLAFKKAHPAAVAILGPLLFAALYAALSFPLKSQTVLFYISLVKALMLLTAYFGGSVIISLKIRKNLRLRLTKDKNISL